MMALTISPLCKGRREGSLEPFPNSNNSGAYHIDWRTAEEINKAEKRLDAILNKELRIISTKWRPLHLEKRKFNHNNANLLVFDVRADVGSATASFRSGLRERVVEVRLKVKDYNERGRYLLTQLGIGNLGHFRSTADETECWGTAAVSESGLEWLVLHCDNRSTVSTQLLDPLGIFRTDNDDLGDKISGSVEGELEEVLTKLLAESMKATLARTKPLPEKLVRNKAYMMTSEQELLDSNTLLDAAINLVVYFVDTRFKDSLPIPDLAETIRINVLVTSLDTGLAARDGVAHGIGTLERRGNARITRRNTTLRFAGALRFRRIRIEYRRYRATVLGLGPAGHLNLTASPVGVGLAMRVDFGTRRIHLDTFKITTLGRTRVEPSGGGRLVGDLSECLASLFRTVIARIVERRTAAFIREALSKNTLDQILTGDLQF